MKRLTVAFVTLSLSLSVVSHGSAQTKAPEGLWLSDGYGLLVEFDDRGLRSYELTSISCIRSRTATRAEYRTPKSATIFTSRNEVIRVTPTHDPDVLRMHADGTASDIVLHRTSAKPKSCETTPHNTPQENYAIFWQTFAQQYPFFALHKVDWHAIDNQFRSQVSADTKPSELFAILRKMIEPLDDSHTGLEAPDINAEFDGWRGDPNHLDENAWKRAESIIQSKYLHGQLHAYCDGHVQFGIVGSAIGYLRVITFYDYVNKGGYAAELECLQGSLDMIFGGTAKLSGLIIDVRLNHGGDDPLGIEIASRLTKKKYLAYTKIVRNNTELDSALHFTDPQPTWVMPSARPGFKGKIVLLTGPDTVSAGETFTMAILGREPQVIRIGLNTQGVFSDVLSRSLPNGWRFHLPNEIYLTADEQAFDATGIPPDIRVPFFSDADLQSGRDAALEEAIKHLAN